MTADRTKSPQEKKALSLARDRRNAYGENDKASRKAIPLRKAREHRAERRSATATLGGLPEFDEATAEVAESSLRQDVGRIGGWRKQPDIPLKEHVARRLARRGADEA